MQVAAAGNYYKAACTYSPADSKAGITVGSSGAYQDAMSWFSDYGPCVDIFAPVCGGALTWHVATLYLLRGRGGGWMQGENVVSVGIKDPNSWATMSGTSMATPHVVWHDMTIPGCADACMKDQ